MTLLISLRPKVPGIGVLLADHPGAAQQVQLEHVELHPVVGHLEGDALPLAEGLAERGALRGVLAADLERLLGAAEAGGGHEHAGGVEAVHVHVEALALFAEDVLAGQLHVLVDPAAGGEAHAAHVLVGGVGDAVEMGRDPDEGHALVALGGVGLDQGAVAARRAPLGALLGPAHVGLLAVHDEGLLLLVPRRDGLDGAEVRAAAGLGGVDAGERLAGGDGRQHLLLQLVGAVAVDDVRPADGEQRVDGGAHGEVGARDLLDGDHRVDEALVVRDRHAAVLLGDGDAEDAEVGHAGRDVVGDAVLGLVDGARARLQVLDQPLADGLAEHVLLGGVAEIHAAPSFEACPRKREDPQGTPTRTLGVNDLRSRGRRRRPPAVIGAAAT